MDLDEARAAVAAGAAWLDTQPAGIPADWRSRIDAGDLNIASNDTCIGGQLCGGYYPLIETIMTADGVDNTVAAERSVAYGFFPPDDVADLDLDSWHAYQQYREDAAVLTAIWREYLS